MSIQNSINHRELDNPNSAASLLQVVPNLPHFDDDQRAHFDGERNHKPIERLNRVLSVVSAEISSSDAVPVIDASKLVIDKKKRFGTGGNAVVYEAVLTLDKPIDVAVKVPLRRETNEDRDKTMKHAEQQIVKLQSHKSFVGYYGVCHDTATKNVMLVMEPLLGKSLRFHFDTAYLQISFRSKVNILLQAARALMHAHSKNVLVTDFKLDNIVFVNEPDFENNRNLEIKLIDVFEKDFTIPYSCKKVLENEFSNETDIYTFGVVCWEFFSGRMPYSECKNHFQQALKIGAGVQLEIPEDVPLAIRDMILACWKSPCEITMRDIVEILSDIDSNIEPFEWTTAPIPVDLF